MLFTKCILSARVPEDGLRISVMSRHTLSDGITPDIRITQDKFDIHVSIFAPSSGLIGEYYKLHLPWNDFEARYLAEIRSGDKRPVVELLAEQAMQQDITLLCIEDKPVRCHRRLLAEECKRLQKRLKVVHR